jgi:beta-lactamase superfamily II metal-dependent hydrolase
MNVRQTQPGVVPNNKTEQLPQKDSPETQRSNAPERRREQFEIPEGVMYCKLDAVDARSDYRENTRCARLFGISADEFARTLNTDSIHGSFEVFLMDVDWSLWQRVAVREVQQDKARFFDAEAEWLEVSYRADPSLDSGEAYAYPLFLGSAPTFLEISAIRPVVGKAVPPLRTAVAVPASRRLSSSPYVLDGFHVGQGMCSVFHNEKSGFILDAGAGTPVLRKVYDRAGFVNELMPLVSNLEPLSMVLSHFDADHWRLLDWDEELLAHVDKIYVPDNYSNLPFKSKAIKDKVLGIGTQPLLSDASVDASLDVVRSKPNKSNKNGECLVAVCRTQGKSALLPGDYSYRRLKTDGATEMQLLAMAQYDAVVVPHHGDEASADKIVKPASDTAIAFFSAGDHSWYEHPNADSLENHEQEGYVIVNKNTLVDIKLQKLLP